VDHLRGPQEGNPFREPFDKHAPRPVDPQNRPEKAHEKDLRPDAGFDLAEGSNGRGLKAGEVSGEASDMTKWPRPDFGYKVPFPTNAR